MGLADRAPYTVTKLAEGFWAIGQDFVRCFLLAGSRRALLLDSCDADARLDLLVAELTDKPVTLVQTHCDADHIGASRYFADLRMHPSEFHLLRMTSDLPLAPAAIWEWDVLDLGGRQLEVLLLPGHTPGSIALLDRENRILFSGDTVKDNVMYMFGPGRDLPAYTDSLERLYAMRDAFDAIYACHGRLPVTSALIPDLIEGARRLHAGELSGEDDGSGLPCKLYTHGGASFYY